VERSTHLPDEKEPRQDNSETYTLTLDELATKLRTDLKQGLTYREAEERHRIYGPNVVQVKQSIFKTYVAPFLNWLIDIYLIVSVVLALLALFLLPEIWGRVIYWLSIIAVNIFITLVQETRAQTRLKAIEELSAPKSKVVREGRLTEIPADQVVPGDIIRLREGDKVPADARIIDASNLRVNEASLTGESEEVEKYPGIIQVDECRTLSGIRNNVFLGTYVNTGYATALVTKIGEDTQIGRISSNMGKVTREILLRTKVNKLAKYLTIAVLAYLAIYFLDDFLILRLRYAFVRGLNLHLLATDVSRGLIMAMSIMPINIPLLTTLILVTGVLVMAGHRIIVRDLNAVEGLGRVSVICSDKTGTITKDEMTVKWILLPSTERKVKLYGVTGVGFQPYGKILPVDSNMDLSFLKKEPDFLGGGEAEIKAGSCLELLLVSGLLNNDSSIIEERVETTDYGGQVKYRALGDASDASILVMFRKSRLDEDLFKSGFQEVYSFPFDSKLKRMTRVFKHEGRYVLFTKGATETILSLCSFIAKDDLEKVEALNDAEKTSAENMADVFSASAFRVISFAFRYLDELPPQGERDFLEKDLTYLGFVAIIDPPREDVLESIVEAKSAGIKTVIITGDSVETGKSIAEEVGILEEEGLAVEGCDIGGLSDEDFLRTSVFARVLPENKMEIIDRYKKEGRVVAMSGDGVNDALAISRADVGIAMGITGTDVAKEAADMIITDDSFNSIITGIRQGRGLFQKIRAIVFFYVAVNLAEAIVFFGTSLIPGFFLLTLWQHQLITITTHSIPPFALIIDRLSRDAMKEKPRDTEDIFTKRLAVALLLFAISLSVVLYVGYAETLRRVIPLFDENKMGFIPHFDIIDPANPSGWAQAKARTILYTIIVVAECTLVISLRRINKPVQRILKEDNYWVVWLFILIVPAALLALMYIPETQLILETYAGINLEIIRLTTIDWIIAIILGLIPVALLEYYKMWTRKRDLVF